MKDAKKLLSQQFDDLTKTLQKVITFNTEKGPAEDGAPFGRQVRNCLDYVLATAESFGFTTYNDDGYAGHVDFKGTGDKVVGILGHLDVVPPNGNIRLTLRKYTTASCTAAEQWTTRDL